MTAKPSTAPAAASRTAAGGPTRAAGWSLRRLLDACRRPIALQWRDGRLHLVFAQKRRTPEPGPAQPLRALRGELRARLLAHEHEHAALAMRHLVFVHDELGRSGWTGVEAMPAQVLRKALLQAQMLHEQEASPALGKLIDRIRVLTVAADLREERMARHTAERRAAEVEVTETTHAEFEALERRISQAEGPLRQPHA